MKSERGEDIDVLGVTVRQISYPETLDFAIVRFGVPSLESPDKSDAVEICVPSPDENIHRVVGKGLEILIDRIETQLAEAKKAQKIRLESRGD